jgi:hypothetical protein
VAPEAATPPVPSIAEIVSGAITDWNGDLVDERAWKHAGAATDQGCASWVEGLLCCTNPGHPDQPSLVAAIATAVEKHLRG